MESDDEVEISSFLGGKNSHTQHLFNFILETKYSFFIKVLPRIEFFLRK